jgi:hypothetical protein
MEEKANVVININGGNTQILPNATEAVQNFYGDQFAEKVLAKQSGATTSLNEENDDSDEPEIPYINKVYAKEYAEQLRNCATGREVGMVVARMVKEGGLFDETAKKEMFIEKLIPFLDHLTKGKTVDNLRKHIRTVLDEQNVR